MEKRSVLSTIRFIFFTVLALGLIFTAVVITVLNNYKPAVKAYVNDDFIGYFSSEAHFDEVYNDLVVEKQSIDPNVKVYLDYEPTFESSYIRDSLMTDQNVYTNLRAEIKTEYTIYEVAVNDKVEMTFNSKDEANKYAEDVKNKVSDINKNAKIDVKINEQKVNELGEMTSVERADAILKDIVDRNKPVEVPKTSTTTTTKSFVQTAQTIGPTFVDSTGSGVWPTVNRRINCEYMGYAGHTGIDLGGAVGTAIYAYRSGTVTFAGWGTGYGLHVKVDHGNGMSTLYAHCSELLVSPGQQVSEGEMIAKIGLTGYTTGPHLHFEVRLNGVPTNPYGYIAGK